MKTIFKVALSAALLVCVALLFNWATLDRIVQRELSQDIRNEHITVRMYHRWLVSPSSVVFDLRGVGPEASRLDVTRTILQAAKATQNRVFDKVFLAHNGEVKFYFEGRYFQRIGREHEYQNPIYTVRTIPENVYTLGGRHAFGVWEGGVLGVVSKQMEDLNEFHNQWYLWEVASKR